MTPAPPRVSLLLLLLPLLATDLWAAPLTKYDQRQEGELNVHAHLENFIILLIPGGGGGLFNIAAKIAPGKHHGGKHVKGSSEGTPALAPVGVKNPPYKVDIDADRRVPIVLEITAPRVAEEQHEVVIAESPAVSLTRKDPAQKEAEKPSAAPAEPQKEEDPSQKPGEDAEAPMETEEKKEPAKATGEAPATSEKPEPAPVGKPTKKPIEEQPAAAPAPAAVPVTPSAAVGSVAAAAAPADKQKEAAAPSRPERPAGAAKPAAAPPAPAPPAPAPPAPAPAQAPQQVAQEAKSRAARLELLRTGLVASPSAPCAPHEVRDGRCARAHQPARVSKSYEDAVLLKALQFGLSPAN